MLNFSNILSIKAASGRIEEVTELRAICGSEISVYSGDDSLLLPMLSVGAVGVVSVASHLVGLQLKEMIDSFQSGEVSNALAIHEKLQPLLKHSLWLLIQSQLRLLWSYRDGM